MSKDTIARAATLAGLAALTAALLGAGSASASPSQITIFDTPRELTKSGEPLRNFTLNELAGAGVNTVRYLVYWREFAPSPESSTRPGGSFDPYNHTTYPQGSLYQLDNLIAAVRQRGMDVELTVGGPFPRWASESGQSQVMNPKPDEYLAFLYALGSRYGGGWNHDGNSSTPPPTVRIWGIYNEPNVKAFLGPQYDAQGTLVAPKIYRQLYIYGRAGLALSGHSEDKILIGETGPRASPRAIPPIKFLKSALCLDDNWQMSEDCDMLPASGWATHPYSFRKAPWEPSDNPDDLTLGNIPKLVDALDRAAAAGALPPNLPIYITEYGIQSEPDPYTGVPVEQQAEYLAISEYISYRNSRIRGYAQYLMRDDPRDLSGTPYGGFETGLRYENGAIKPSYLGFHVPLAVRRQGDAQVRIWGQARPFQRMGSPPSLSQARIRIVDPGKPARHFKTVDLDARGHFSTTGFYRAGRLWRLVWDRPQNNELKGPWVRAYAF